MGRERMVVAFRHSIHYILKLLCEVALSAVRPRFESVSAARTEVLAVVASVRAEAAKLVADLRAELKKV